jgi:hypothetical protein
MMGLAGGGVTAAVVVAAWTLLSGEAARAGAESPGTPRAIIAGPVASEAEPSMSLATTAASQALSEAEDVEDVEDIAEAIAELETRGELPVLDRTDSLAGIDADANGIRDDLDRFIDRSFGDAARREAAVQLTKTIQQTLLVDAGDHAAVMTLARHHTNDLSCFSSRFQSDRASGSELRRQLHSLTTNTKARLLAYMRFDQALSGQTFRLPEGDGCE